MASSVEDVFKSFCAFGAGSKDTVALMDNSKFAKLCRDMKLLDKKLTATDVDIMFNRCKLKTERKITFAQFEDALKLMAEKKYPGDPKGLQKLRAKLTAGSAGPATHGATKTVSSDVLERMTDTSKYTGSHKLRFDESGKGRGLEGRDSVAKGKGMTAGSVASQTPYVSGYKHEGTYDSPDSSPKTSPRVTKGKSDTAVVDRLTDSSKYTGSHKQRFDSSGHGKGLGGRDAPSKGAAMSPSSVGSQKAYVSGYKQEGTYGKKK